MQKVLFIFAELSDDDIDWIISTGATINISSGSILIAEGKPVNALYIILEGAFKVSVGTGGIDKKIALLGSGEVVGEMSFIDARMPSATVEAIADSFVLAIPRSLLADKLKNDVNFSSHFYRALA